MLPSEIILKKRNGKVLSEKELEYFVMGYVKNEIPDYQMAAFLMAVYFQGMNEEETATLTRIMINSGETVDLSPIKGIKVDKHSTGGVGDTTTLVLAPLVASCGVPVAKMSGRGLGHTGGTLDKLESIPGMNVSLTREEFIKQVQKIGVAIIGQTANLVPADKKMYALRDVTATIDSIPLIAGSIMSKKIAAGSDAILLDVKVGNGAFMKKYEDAKKLANLMVKIGSLMKRKTRAIITDMNQPLGSHIGNALEVKEAIEILRGEHKGSALWEVSLTLGSHMLYLGGEAISTQEGMQKIRKALQEGKGLEKMAQLIEAQGGNPKVVEDLSLLPSAKHEIEILSPKSGFVYSYNTQDVGRCAQILGAGRAKKGDPIDPAVGLIVKKRIGDMVDRKEPIATIFANDPQKAEEASHLFLKSICIKDEKPEVPKLIKEVIMQDKILMEL